jgi:hypothetical protein
LFYPKFISPYAVNTKFSAIHNSSKPKRKEKPLNINIDPL